MPVPGRCTKSTFVLLSPIHLPLCVCLCGKTTTERMCGLFGFPAEMLRVAESCCFLHPTDISGSVRNAKLCPWISRAEIQPERSGG